MFVQLLLASESSNLLGKMEAKVSIVECESYAPILVQEAVKGAIDLIGGIASFIRPHSKVLIKPNLLMARQPDCGITTHPEVARAVIKILKDINCQIYLGDGPSVWNNQVEDVDKVYDKTGMRGLSEEEGIELVRFDKSRWRKKFPLTCWLDACDYLVSIPKFKTHNLTILTAAIKNLFGLVSPHFKMELHRRYFSQADFAKILVDIYEEVRPALTVIDGVVALEGDGPGTGGRLRNLGLVFAGPDCVSLDSILALVMGLEPLDILTNKEASKRGIGIADINFINILGDINLEDLARQPFQLPATSIIARIPAPLAEIAKKLVRFYPKVDYSNCVLCGICINACPEKIIKLKDNRINIDYTRCISCFCCLEFCPNSAIKVNKSILAKIIGL